MQLTFDLVVKVILPLGTFVLGIVSTLLIKRAEARRDNRKASAKETADLLNQWYNQLHSLKVDLASGKRSKDAQKAKEFYLENRLVLPLVIRHREILYRIGKDPDIVSTVDEFLSIVTDYESLKQVSFDGKSAMFCKDIFRKEAEDVRYSEPLALQQFLSALDPPLQSINRLVGRVLAT